MILNLDAEVEGRGEGKSEELQWEFDDVGPAEAQVVPGMRSVVTVLSAEIGCHSRYLKLSDRAASSFIPMTPYPGLSGMPRDGAAGQIPKLRSSTLLHKRDRSSNMAHSSPGTFLAVAARNEKGRLEGQ